MNKIYWSFKIWCIFFIVTISLFGYKAFSQTDTRFWFVAPEITEAHYSTNPSPPPPTTQPGGAPIYLHLTSTGLPVEVTVSQPANAAFAPITVNIPGGETETIDLTSRINDIENRPYDIKNNKGLLIEAQGGNITAYYEEDEYYNPDIFSLKGDNALGKLFYVPFQHLWPNGYATATPPATSAIDIVATEDGTDVEIVPTNDVRRSPANGGGVYTAGSTISINDMEAGQTYSIVAAGSAGDEHLGGTRVEVTNGGEIAVTLSDDSDTKSNPGTCMDMNGDQLVPVDVVGKEYLIMQGKLYYDPSDGGERIFMVPTQPNTEIYVDGTQISGGPFQPGDTVSYPVNKNAINVRGTNPIYVYHVTGFGCEMGGAVVPTIDGCTGSNEVSFMRSNDQPFYLNLMVRKGAHDAFYISDTANTYHLDPNRFEFITTSDTTWAVLKKGLKQFSEDTIPVDYVTKVINKKDVFHLGLINGGETTGCKYGYFSDFKEIRGNAMDIGTETGYSISNCYGDTVQLHATGGLSYDWTPEDYLITPPDISNPKALPPVGDTTFEVTISRACYADTTMPVQVKVYEDVEAGFEVDQPIFCAPYELNIFNKTTNADTLKWDFQDNRDYDTSMASVDTLRHTYYNKTNKDSIYRIKLFARNRLSGCADQHIRSIRVHPEINAGFTQDNILGCNPLEVTFTDTSSGNTYSDGYEWDFDDGASSDSDTTVTHNFVNNRDTDTTYNVQLVTTSPELCRDTAYQSITVRSFVDAAFTIDTVMGCSPLTVDISNNSKGDVTEAYWNFNRSAGGSYSDTTYSKSAAPNPTFTNTGTIHTDTIDIELIVTNGNCYDTTSRTVYVYPEVTASYNPGNIDGCNPLSITYDNQSTYTGLSNDTTGLSYNWDFGDGSSSIEFEPSHIFENMNPAEPLIRWN